MVAFDNDDPRYRRKAVPGASWHDRMFRRAAEREQRRDWAQRLSDRQALEPEGDEPPAPAPPPAPTNLSNAGWSSDAGHAGSRGHAGNRGHVGNRGHEGNSGRDGSGAPGYIGRSDGFAPTTHAEIEAAEEGRRMDRRAAEEERGVEVGKNGHVLAGLKPDSRKPGGRFRAGQRAPGRNPPAPSVPVSPPTIELVLGREWLTPGGWVNTYRRRALAALAVALALPPKLSGMKKLCALRPHDLLMLDLRMPAKGWRHVLAWLETRQGMVGEVVAFNTSWLAIPGVTNGRPRMIGWAMTQTLHRAGAPAWRPRELVRASWAPYIRTVSCHEATRRRRA